MKHFKNYSPSTHRVGSGRVDRKTGLRGLAHVIALKLYDLCAPYFDRNQEPPEEFLSRTFEMECKTARIRGGPLSADEIKLLMNTLVPKALAAIEDNVKQADAKLVASVKAFEQLAAA